MPAFGKEVLASGPAGCGFAKLLPSFPTILIQGEAAPGLPLALSRGAGAGAQNAIGIAVIGGVVAGTVLGVLLVPVFYVVIAYKDPPRFTAAAASLTIPPPVSKRRPAWTAIAGTPARHTHALIEHDGVTVLCVRLSGYAENRSGGVARITDALDALPHSLPADPDVSTLDVTAFSNAWDDASAILTSVFTGLPCCWISGSWDQQRGGERWDLPPSERMAATPEAALDRVASWRRAGGFSLSPDGGTTTRTWRWTGRGLLISDRGRGDDCDDLWHRSRLVERTIHRARPTRIRLPWPDRTGEDHDALRRMARLVLTDDRVIEADFSEWSTGRALVSDWVDRIADLTSLETLVLPGAARERDILRAVRLLPALHTLALMPGALGPEALAELRRERPDLSLR